MAYPKGRPRLDSRKYQDEFRYIRYIPYLRQRAQASYRGESWTLTFDEFCELWPDECWALRGRTKGCMVMCLKNHAKGWHKGNVEVISKSQAIGRLQTIRLAKKRNENGK